MSVIQTSGFTIPSDPASQKKILDALNEISKLFSLIESTKDQIKDIVQVVVDEHNLPKKYVNKVARIHHKQNFSQLTAENEQLEILYETLIKR